MLWVQNTSKAQPLGNHAANWVFGDFKHFSSTGVSLNPVFTGGVYTLPFPGYGAPREGTACISDNSGNLLFSTDGEAIRNNTYSIAITGLQGNNRLTLPNNPSATQAAVIVPHPGITNRYVIFTTSAGFIGGGNNPDGLKYHIVDALPGSPSTITSVSLNNALIPNSSNPNARCTEKLCAIKESDNRYWVLTIATNADNTNYNLFYAYPVTNAGVGTPVVTTDPTVVHASIGQMKFSAGCGPGLGRSMVHLGISNFATQGVYLYQFNLLTGAVIPNPVNRFNTSTLGLPSDSRPYGMEFSPGSNNMYVSTTSSNFTHTNRAAIVRYNLTTMASTTMPMAGLLGPGITIVGANGLQVARDGNIYMCYDSYYGTSYGASENNIARIDNPNSAAPVIVSVPPGLGKTYASVPNFYVIPYQNCPCGLTVDYEINADYTITGTQNWTGASNPFSTNPVQVNGTIFIPVGSALNLNNITLEFSPTGKIVIQGGTLITRNNTVLKAVENCMWQGVELYSPNNQLGNLDMRQSTIRDARVGVQLGSVAGTAPFLLAGKADIRNCTLLNNRIGMRFSQKMSNSPTYPHQHRVQNTLFRCDAPMLEPTTNPLNPTNRTEYFQWMNIAPHFTNPELQFVARNNTYINLLTPAASPSTPVANQTTAIQTRTTLFPVANCTFTNVLYGVNGSSVITDPRSYTDIANNTFNRNMRSVTLIACQGIIRNNSFNNGIVNTPLFPDFINPVSIGVYLQSCGVTSLYENNIQGYAIGAVSDNGSSTAFNTEITHNTFRDNYLYGLGTGGTHDNTTVECNEFRNFTTDLMQIPQRIGAWYLYDVGTAQLTMKDQGSFIPPQPAGNSFYPISPIDYRIYTNTTNPNPTIFTYHWNGPTQYDPNPHSLNVSDVFLTGGTSPTAYCNTTAPSPFLAFPRPAPLLLAQLALAGSASDSTRILQELYFRYLENKDSTGVENVLLARANNKANKRALVDFYLSTHRPAQALTVLNTLPATATADIVFRNYYLMQYNHVLAGKPNHTIDSTQASTVRTWRDMRTDIMGLLMSSLHANHGDSIWVDCDMLGLCPGSSSRMATVPEQSSVNNTPNIPNRLYPAYPNPANDIVHIQYELAPNTAGSIEIYNLMGVKVRTYDAQGIYGSIDIPVSDLPNGMYIYTLIANGKVTDKQKFLIQK